MNIRNLMVSFMMITTLFSQSVVGTVLDTDSKPLEGANVVIVGTDLGATADDSGAFSMQEVPAGTYDVTATFIGYSPMTLSVVVGEEGTSVLDFELEVGTVVLSDVEVLASRASENTPVAYTNIDKVDMEMRLGSQDLPMILNTTPSVYALSLIHI